MGALLRLLASYLLQNCCNNVGQVGGTGPADLISPPELSLPGLTGKVTLNGPVRRAMSALNGTHAKG
jgi:hypothetical protein